MRQRLGFICALLTVAAVLAAAGGCSSKPRKMTPEYVRGHLSPEMSGLARTKEDRKNEWARTSNTNLRQIPDDVDSILLMDRPVRMSPYVIP